MATKNIATLIRAAEFIERRDRGKSDDVFRVD